MKKHLFIALVSASLFACKKSSNPINPIANDRQLVDSVITLLKTFSADAKKVIHYEYDSKNRVTVLHENYFNYPSPSGDHIYEYDVRGNLVRSTINRSGKTSIFEYTYKDDVPVSASYREPASPSNNYDLVFTVENGLITHSVIAIGSGGTAKVTYEYANGNHTNEIYQSFSASATKAFTLTDSYEYGSKKSPYLYSGNKWFLPDVVFANKNDNVKTTSLVDGGSPSVVYFTNAYDKNGYPTTVTTVGAPGTTADELITYKYIPAK